MIEALRRSPDVAELDRALAALLTMRAQGGATERQMGAARSCRQNRERRKHRKESGAEGVLRRGGQSSAHLTSR